MLDNGTVGRGTREFAFEPLDVEKDAEKGFTKKD